MISRCGCAAKVLSLKSFEVRSESLLRLSKAAASGNGCSRRCIMPKLIQTENGIYRGLTG